MLKLKQVTLMSIDVVHPIETINAMRYSMRWVEFAEAILLTDTKRFPDVRPPDIRLIHHEETNRKVSVPGQPHPIPVDYERACMRMPDKCVKTDYCLHMEWDSAVLNPLAWDRRWLRYDFIGAPWPRHTAPGWPPCDHTNNVGNGGFCLQSRRWMENARLAAEQWPDDPGAAIHDAWLARTLRPWMEAQGVRYAPWDVAMRFSCENAVYCGQFGYHGVYTAELNGWGGTKFGHVRPKVRAEI